MRFKNYCIFFFICLNNTITSKVLIFSYAFNNTKYIEWQVRCFERFMLDDYELIIFNNASEKLWEKAIEKVCAELSVSCIRVPPEIHDNQQYIKNGFYGAASIHHCRAVQWSLETIGFNHDDILLIFDGDLFLIKPFSFNDWMENSMLSGFYKYAYGKNNSASRIPYLWIGLISMRINELPDVKNFNICCAQVDQQHHHLDSGGATYFYMKKNKNVIFKEIEKTDFSTFSCLTCRSTLFSCCSHNAAELFATGFNANEIVKIQQIPLLPFLNIEFYLNYSFVHYQGGSNYHDWDSEGKAAWELKQIKFEEFMQQIIGS